MAPLPRHQRVIIALSVHILRSGVARCSDVRVDGVEVRLALRCLLPHCAERWPLELYWDAAQQENDIGCGSAWKRDPGSGVIGVEKGPLIPVV